MDKIKVDNYRTNKNFKIADNETFEDFGKSDKELKKELSSIRRELGEFQDTIYAHGKYSILVCLQGMDTAGKDSLIREVFKDFNVSGVEVHSFKVPTELELSHNYLWRHYLVLPAKGKFGVFNRTHYENVLVTRVHPEYILSEHIPGIHTVDDIDQNFWDKRFEQINDFERHLAENGTLIFKFFLNLSKEEQRQRLLRRLAIKEKHWKFSPGDLKERKLWDVYQKCYEEAISKTTHDHAPWFAIPADNKKATRIIVASILLQSLKKYKDIKEPMLSDKIKANLDSYEEQLQGEQ
ncbi:PPK2 family polyphosphate kinase [Maribacter stanieri]|jgi:PPK2 family polyphosphate:nucleotide phosphotransferase|uniref:Polyphosphate:nucleotide phosphotransferase, PPK2 family n=1 Tax=Maribacter stanieri TaxID=440514 RepID=A0A1I6IL27_9FLAO|nr:PPK2 family polyphosphate kinase [Maribacter stanieri]SFR67435.1 polyphosphate:nucleotide phosphotransferase, PPK2 family [Maribacter stanieri]|tara:strand:- start:1464 stop:2345 length:882 start_codon:yes stop_codon:yes gene_type:complete